MISSLYKEFNALRSQIGSISHTYLSKSVSLENDIRIGIDQECSPVILIPEKKLNVDNWNKVNHKLKYLELMFHQLCQLSDFESGTVLKEKYTIICLSNASEIMIKYFLEIMELLIAELNKDFSILTLNRVIGNLIKLFSQPSQIDESSIIGLWGELLFILESEDIANSVAAWHNEKTNLFDFTFNDHNLEVKTTTGSHRLHTFNNNQIKEYKRLRVQICSIQTEKATLGRSIQDLWEEISRSNIDVSLKEKCSQILIETIGLNASALSYPKFDYNLGVSTLKFFASEAIPSIESEYIANSIREIKLKIDLDAL